MRKIVILFALILVAVVPAVGQKRDINLTITVTGPSGSAISDAQVALKQTDYSLTYGSISLDAEGKALVKVYSGNHSLTVTRGGYNDAISTFNVTADTTVNVQLTEKNQLPYALSVNVSHDAMSGLNDATFSWNTEAPVFWDDFESYSPFAVEFSPWSGIDGDQLNAATLAGTYLNTGVREYAQIINPLKVTPSWWYDYPVLRPYSGQQYVGFIRTATGEANDDWLITPTLTPGTDNVFSFMAKAADVYKEKFQVYITTVVDNPTKKDFVQLNDGNYETVDYKAWYCKTYDLAKYAGSPVKLAIRFMSSANNGGSFMLMIDDVYVGQKFANPNASKAPRKARRIGQKSPANPNETFRVFLNDQQVGTTDGYSYDFPNLTEGTYKFGVQAVYASSETAVVDTVVTIENNDARFEVVVSTNNGVNVDGQKVELIDEVGSDTYEAVIENGKAVFPSLPKKTYYMGIAAPNFNVFKQTVTISGNTTLNVTLLELIVNPYNITADVTPKGVNKNDVLVKWNQNLAFRDDFEAYDDFATGKFGEWTTYDIDQHICYPIGLGSASNIVTFPGCSTPSSPQPVPPLIFNPWHTVPAMMPTDKAVMAVSGDKTVAFFSPQMNGANKWLVSPEVQIRDNFVCRFTAKAYSDYPESMEVCVFTDGASNPQADNYEVASTISQLTTGQWTIYETDLAKYVGQNVRIGVHYTSFDAFFAQIDDFYVGNLSDDGSAVDVGEVKGYNVQLDGAGVAEVTAPEVVLTEVGAGKHTVGVQAKYTSGLSEFTTYDFTVALSGDINGDGAVNSADVSALVNAILEGKTESLYDVNGDGTVNSADVSALVNVILAQQ